MIDAVIKEEPLASPARKMLKFVARKILRE
jgi:hypothetical protein